MNFRWNRETVYGVNLMKTSPGHISPQNQQKKKTYFAQKYIVINLFLEHLFIYVTFIYLFRFFALSDIYLYIIFFLLWKSMVPQNSLVTNFLQNIFLCVQQNKDIHTGLELLEGE